MTETTPTDATQMPNNASHLSVEYHDFPPKIHAALAAARDAKEAGDKHALANHIHFALNYFEEYMEEVHAEIASLGAST